MRLRMRLWSKLALVMVVAALLPLVLASAMAMRLALGRLDRQLEARAGQTAGIAMNLLLRQVQQLSGEVRSLAGSSELHELLTLQPALVPKFLQGYAGATRWALLEVADGRGRVVGRRSPPHSAFARLRASAASGRRTHGSLTKALDYEHHVTLVRIDKDLAIQVAAPVVDAQYTLRGAAMITVPLDRHMADYIKSVLRAEVGFLRGQSPLASTFFKQSGERLLGPVAPPEVVAALSHKTAAGTVRKVADRAYSLVFTPLQNVDGELVGAMVVGLDRSELARAQASAVQSLALGGVAALFFAVGLALFLGRRITRPLARLEKRTRAIAAGELERELSVEQGDEIGELAWSFNKMTAALRENQEWLNARIRELSTLHQISRAVSSVLTLDEVLRLVITEVAEVLDARRTALLLADDQGGLELCDEVGFDEDEELPADWARIAEEVVERQSPSFDERLIGVPLMTREHVVGVLMIGRAERQGAFSDADVRLVLTFAGQAATAIDNARLYAEVMVFSEELEAKVQQRTAELRAANAELALTIAELRDTQAQLIHSERMAGIGSLVAGVAHEINTPAGAIQGMSQVLGETVARMAKRFCSLSQGALPPEELSSLVNSWAGLRGERDKTRIPRPAEVRRRARALGPMLEARGLEDAHRIARRLVEAEVEPLAEQVADAAAKGEPDLVVGLIEDLSFLERSARQIQSAIATVVRIVRALRNYAHSDRESVTEVDITDGLETTLTILHNQVRYGINVVRKYAALPMVPAYVDELNQVWTNLIHNAVQAMGGEGELTIETFVDGDEVGVRISDTGPGVPPDVLPKIFEPFFSTKERGEGTGLGLGIARKIIGKHGGQIAVESHPGATTFTVVLPVSGPPRREVGEGEVSEGQVSEGQVSEGEVSEGQVSEGEEGQDQAPPDAPATSARATDAG